MPAERCGPWLAQPWEQPLGAAASIQRLGGVMHRGLLDHQPTLDCPVATMVHPMAAAGVGAPHQHCGLRRPVKTGCPIVVSQRFLAAAYDLRLSQEPAAAPCLWAKVLGTDRPPCCPA